MDKTKQAKWFLNPKASFLRLQTKIECSRSRPVYIDEYMHKAYTAAGMGFEEGYDTTPEMINDYIKLEEYLDS